MHESEGGADLRTKESLKKQNGGSSRILDFPRTNYDSFPILPENEVSRKSWSKMGC